MIELPLQLETYLYDLANKSGQTVPEFLTELLTEYELDRQLVASADQEMEKIKLGESKTIPLSDVMLLYGLEH